MLARCKASILLEKSDLGENTYKEHPDNFCSTLEGEKLSICYVFIPSFMISNYDYNFDELLDLCLDQKDQNVVRTCVRGIGTVATYPYSSAKRFQYIEEYTIDENAVITCYKLPGEYIEDCIKGVLDIFVLMYNDDLKRTYNFCGKIADEHKKTCFNYVGLMAGRYLLNEDELRELCVNKIQEYEETCILGGIKFINARQ